MKNDSTCKNLVYTDGHSWPCHRKAPMGCDGYCRICAAAKARGKKVSDKNLAEYRKREDESTAARAQAEKAVERLAALGLKAKIYYLWGVRTIGRYTGEVIVGGEELVEKLERGRTASEIKPLHPGRVAKTRKKT